MNKRAHNIFMSVLAASALVVSGCNESPRSGTDSILAASPPSFDRDSNDDRPTPRTDSGADADAPSDTTRDLIEQAQRDVASWMQLNDADDSTVEHADASPTESAPRAADIQWSDPVGAGDPLAANEAPEPEDIEANPAEVGEDDVAAPAEDNVEVDDATPSTSDIAPVQRTLDELSAMDDDQISELIVELCSELYQQGAYEDQPLRQLLLIAAMSLHDPDRQLDADALPGLVERERALLGALQSMFVDLGQNLNEQNDPYDVVVKALDSVRDQLVEKPRLDLTSAALCTEVAGFGSYTPFDRNAFLAQSDQQVVLYLEVDGFTSEQNDEGEWITRISQQLEIYRDDDGIPVWREDWQTAVDQARNRRNDFFMVQLVTLPSRLSVGSYHLKIRVRDELSKAEAETGIPFTLVADERMASSQASR